MTAKAIGTPVDPATTDAGGSYTLNLPIGSYTLRASAGGCTEFGFAEVELVDAAVEAGIEPLAEPDFDEDGFPPAAADDDSEDDE